MRSAYLKHHGILGQKWGVRRYQNEDGTLTEEGKKRQRELESGKASKEQLLKDFQDLPDRKHTNEFMSKAENDIANSEYAMRYAEAVARSSALDQDAMAINATMGFGAVPLGRGAGEVALRLKELEDYGQTYVNEHIDEFAGATLKDLGYADTKQAREYLKKLGVL